MYVRLSGTNKNIQDLSDSTINFEHVTLTFFSVFSVFCRFETGKNSVGIKIDFLNSA